jgi:hypothetical protein
MVKLLRWYSYIVVPEGSSLQSCERPEAMLNCRWERGRLPEASDMYFGQHIGGHSKARRRGAPNALRIRKAAPVR